jgi:hypothetical protein
MKANEEWEDSGRWDQNGDKGVGTERRRQVNKEYKGGNREDEMEEETN